MGRAVQSVRHSWGRSVPGKGGRKCVPLYNSHMWGSLRATQQAALQTEEETEVVAGPRTPGIMFEILVNPKRKVTWDGTRALWHCLPD